MNDEKKINSYYGNIQDVKLQKKGTSVKISIECDPANLPPDLAIFAVHSIGCPAGITIEERPAGYEEA